MALQNVTDISVDFYDRKYILINAKQYDKQSRFLSISCYNHGEVFSINSGEHSAYVRYKKADNNSVFNFCEIQRKGNVLVELTEQMLASDGICCVDLVIVNKGEAKVDTSTGEIITIDNASILSTMPIYIDVHATAVENSDIESSYEFDGLNTALQKAEAEYTEVIQLSKSYAMGNAGGIRPNEDTDNSKYYYKQSLNSANNSEQSAQNSAESERLANEHMNNANTYMNNANTYMNNAETYMNNAETYMNNAKDSETNAKDSENKAKTSETNAATSEANAKDSEDKAKTSEINSKDSENNAKTSEINAKNSEDKAKTSETNSKDSENKAYASEQLADEHMNNAQTYMDNAETYMNNAKTSETNAKTSETNSLISEQNSKMSEINALNSANFAKSYTVGGTGTRDNEEKDNTRYYYDMVKTVVDGLNSGFIPMGTIAFSELATAEKATGFTYNISDDFVTDETFREGAGKSYTAGTNVYYTFDGHWDCFGGAASPTASVDEVKSYLGI